MRTLCGILVGLGGVGLGIWLLRSGLINELTFASMFAVSIVAGIVIHALPHVESFSFTPPSVTPKSPEQIAQAILDNSMDDLVFKWNGPEAPLDALPISVAERQRRKMD